MNDPIRREMILVFDTKGQITYVNEDAVEIMGYFEDEFLEMNIADILSPDQLENINKEALLAGEKEAVLQDIRFIDRGMNMLPMQVKVSLTLKNGSPSGTRIAAGETVTPEKAVEVPASAQADTQAETRPKSPVPAEEEVSRLIAEAVKEMILAFDTQGKITYINERGAELLGYSQNELSNMNVSDIFSSDQLEILKKGILRKPVSGKRKIVLPEAVFFNRSGKNLPLEITCSLIVKNDKPSDIVLLARDLSRRKRMEKELLTVQKFESLATLAGGLADDLNNYLTAIMGHIDLAMIDSESGGKIYEKLSYAKEGCTKFKYLIRQFLVFSKGEKLNRELDYISEFLKKSVLAALAIPNIKCDFFIASDLWPVVFDEEQMRQVIANVIANACEAMASGGQINVYAENITIAPDRKDKGVTIKDGDYVKISVQDQGSGIQEEDIGRIFDPYFTTKKTGRQIGRGLGLTFVYSVIRKHYGYIYAESKPGVRTTFYIYLPASRNSVPQSRKAKKNPGPPKKKVLIMDDEEIIIDVAGQMLETLGYETALSRNGAEAAELYETAMKAGKPFDAVILDLHVESGMGGKETIKKLLLLDPGVKGIVSSGYSNDPEMTDFEKYGFSGIVEKPYSIAELRNILEKVLTSED